MITQQVFIFWTIYFKQKWRNKSASTNRRLSSFENYFRCVFNGSNGALQYPNPDCLVFPKKKKWCPILAQFRPFYFSLPAPSTIRKCPCVNARLPYVLFVGSLFCQSCGCPQSIFVVSSSYLRNILICVGYFCALLVACWAILHMFVQCCALVCQFCALVGQLCALFGIFCTLFNHF